MSDAAHGQVVASAAKVYDQFFVPALFQQFTGPVVERARVGPGDHVLDVACGTGVVACSLEQQVGPSGRVVGLDVNPGMLAVARGKSSGVLWDEGDVAALPYDDATFDAVTCQFGLMFFPDRSAAVAEMLRVLRPGGKLVVAVWNELPSTPGYADMVRLLEDLFGSTVADALRSPFTLGDPQVLERVLRGGGAGELRIDTVPGVARFPSLAHWVQTDIKGWTLAELLDDEQYSLLRSEAVIQLRHHETADGVRFAAPAQLAAVTK